MLNEPGRLPWNLISQGVKCHAVRPLTPQHSVFTTSRTADQRVAHMSYRSEVTMPYIKSLVNLFRVVSIF